MNNMQILAIVILILFGCDEQLVQSKARKITNTEVINTDSTLQTGWYFVNYNKEGVTRQLDKDTGIYYLDSLPILTSKNIKTFEIYESIYGDIGLSMKLDDEGTKAWSDATKKAIRKELAFIVDNKLLQVAVVNAQITGGVTALNRGIYSKEELMAIQKLIED